MSNTNNTAPAAPAYTSLDYRCVFVQDDRVFTKYHCEEVCFVNPYTGAVEPVVVPDYTATLDPQGGHADLMAHTGVALRSLLSCRQLDTIAMAGAVLANLRMQRRVLVSRLAMRGIRA